MNNHKKIYLLMCVSLVSMTLLAANASADAPPPLPNTFSGAIRFENSNGQFDASAGTVIEAYIDNIMKGNSIVETAGKYSIDVIGTNDEDGKTIIFMVNSSIADQSAIFNTSSPPPTILDLIIAPSMHVSIDIMQESINPGSSGVIPVAILSTVSFNATKQVNISSVRFGPWRANESYSKGHIDEDVNNDTFLDLVLHFDTQKTGIQCGDTRAALTGKTIDNMSFEGSDSFRTVGCEKSSPGGNGGGGGGGVSGEKFSNIELREKYDEAIYKDKLTSYRFKNASNPIMFVNITGNVNAGLITTMAEVLKDTSTLVKEDAPGIVYKNVNLWVGTSGFATSKNIKEATIMFRVDNVWIDNKGLERNEIKLVKWEGGKWVTLETSEKMRDGTYTYFQGKTTGFSPFAITGIKAVPSAATPTVIQTRPSPVTTTAQGEAPMTNLVLIIGVIILIAIGMGFYFWRRK